MPVLSLVSPESLTVMVSVPASPLIVNKVAILSTVLLSLEIWILSSSVPEITVVAASIDLMRMLSCPATVSMLVVARVALTLRLSLPSPLLTDNIPLASLIVTVSAPALVLIAHL